IPILNNEERIVVGTTYKQKGQKEAIRAGFRLVGPRLSDIIDHAGQTGNELLVHCWRGGMRSGNFCQFVSMAGIKTHQLIGGYKAYRAKAITSFSLPLKLMIIGGCTGSGKSDILRALKSKGEQVIDLELLALHKGSVFGGLMMSPQPTTEQFQNLLFEEILSLDLSRRIWIEDESFSVGSIFLPEGLWRTMITSPIIEIDVNKGTRIQRLAAEYGTADTIHFLEAMTKLTKKLGGQHFNAAKIKLEQGDFPAVIEILLTYYDKAYRNGLAKNKSRIKHTLSWDGSNAETITSALISM
ncbi:MAG: tRNA 2-selenouridine(34) synthase MnmH, partial [Marivirga sp.]|nr:tRNA 2-selenouridine(34) synthase MnmH [Marivirga sp.]